MKKGSLIVVGRVWFIVLSLFSSCKEKNQRSDADMPSDLDGDDGGDTSENPKDQTLSIQILGEDVPLRSGYSVAVYFENGKMLRVYCKDGQSDPSSDQLSCGESSAILNDELLPFTLTVKALGFRYTTETVDIEALTESDGVLNYTVSLSRLPAFESTDDYRTGFLEDDLEAFKEISFLSNTDMGPVYAVKFVITDVKTEPKVYFQNTLRNPTHYEFVRNILGMDLSTSEFWSSAYSGDDRAFMAGTVMLYGASTTDCSRLHRSIVNPVVLTFFPSDDLTLSQAGFAYRLLEERLGFVPLTGEKNRFFYLPAGDDQEGAISDDVQLFDERDAEWVLRLELYKQVSLQIMNPGLAYGTLRYADAKTLESDIFSIRDIVLLPTLPIQLPIVGGTITEEFQTPLSHVNLMAKNRGTPNITLRNAASMPAVDELIGKLVRFEVTDENYRLTEATLAEAKAFWDSNSRAPVTLEADGDYSELPLFSEVGFVDWIRVGAKAANLAELHQLLGDKAPYGFAVPFFYYNQHMEQTIINADDCDFSQSDCLLSARDEIACEEAYALCIENEDSNLNSYVDSLLADATFTTDTTIRDAALAGLRTLILRGTVDADFGAKLDALVADVFEDSKIRLRSSTNAEDIPGFSGAGLYDSVGAYASGTDAASLEIRKVWASVWNWRAFEERAFWNIAHPSTMMGVAVNQAFVDEAANGVLITQNIADETTAGMYVNVQVGEISVTNPDGSITPEIFSIIPGAIAGTYQAARLDFSTLLPNMPIMSNEEITTLYANAMKVQLHFAELYNDSPYNLALDLEFKLMGENRSLIIKQARPFVD